MVGGTSSTAALPHLGDGVQHGGELTGEEVELLVGHGQPGQAREVRDLLPGQRVLPGGVLMLGRDSTSAVLDGSVLGRLRDPATLRGARPGPPGRKGIGREAGPMHVAIDGDRPHLEDDPGGTVSYLLRLVVPDRPGILGAVATALGDAGVDIVSLDVLERGNGVAVDDVVVDLPATGCPTASSPPPRPCPG